MKRLSLFFVLSLVLFVPEMHANTHSVELNASNQEYLSISDANQTGLGITGDLTIEAWIKLESQPSDSLMGIVTKNDNNTNKSYTLLYRDKNGSKNIYLQTWSSASGSVDNKLVSQTLPLNTWTHIAVTFDASESEMELFINGSLEGTYTGGQTSIASASADFCVGSNAQGTSNYFDGLIDEVRVWNTARTASEIADAFGNELNGNEFGLVGYWKFNNFLEDSSGNGNTLTSHGTSLSTDVPFEGEVVSPGSCSLVGDNIDFEIAVDLIQSGNQHMILGFNDNGIPTVCVSQVEGDFIDEFTFFNNLWTPVSVAHIPSTGRISVIAYDSEGNYREEILNVANGDRVVFDL